MTARRSVVACSHIWIDPEDAPINRAPISTVIGPGRREMKFGRLYVCRECGIEATPIATIENDAGKEWIVRRRAPTPPLLKSEGDS